MMKAIQVRAGDHIRLGGVDLLVIGSRITTGCTLDFMMHPDKEPPVTSGDRIQLFVTVALGAIIALAIGTPAWFQVGLWFAAGWLAYGIRRAR